MLECLGHWAYMAYIWENKKNWILYLFWKNKRIIFYFSVHALEQVLYSETGNMVEVGEYRFEYNQLYQLIYLYYGVHSS